jgi:hypothetical protein
LVQPCDTNLIVIIESRTPFISLGDYQCHKDQPTSATRRRFLNTATIATAATAATLTASPIAQGRTSPIKSEWRRHPEAKPIRPPRRRKEAIGHKPASHGDPQRGVFKQEQGRYGVIYPRTPANYGF